MIIIVSRMKYVVTGFIAAISVDEQAPAGVLPADCPVWQVGDRFVYLRGGVVRLPYEVLEAGAADSREP